MRLRLLFTILTLFQSVTFGIHAVNPCEEAIRAIQIGDMDAAADYLACYTASPLNHEDVRRVACALVEEARPMKPETAQKILSVVTPPYVRAAQEHISLNAQTLLFLGNRNVDLSRRLNAAEEEASCPVDFVSEVMRSHSGTRALAYASLSRTSVANLELTNFLRERDQMTKLPGEKPQKINAADAVNFLDHMRRSAAVRESFQRAEDFYRALFVDDFELYEQYAHSPLLLGYIFYTFLKATEDRELSEFAARAIERVGLNHNYRPAKDLFAYLKTKLKQPDAQTLLLAHLRYVTGRDGTLK